ncbi:MAG: hypothetical protein ACQEP8_03855 [Chlamydiota bacterium]
MGVTLYNNLRPKIKRLGERLGELSTLGLSKWKYTANVWNDTFEPLFIVGLTAIRSFISGFTKGLLSDNYKGKMEDHPAFQDTRV